MAINEGRLPLGILRQAVMKMESVIVDMNEACEDVDVDDDERELFKGIAEIQCSMIAHIVNIVSKEMNEEEFINEAFPMDSIDDYPGIEAETDDIMNTDIE